MTDCQENVKVTVNFLTHSLEFMLDRKDNIHYLKNKIRKEEKYNGCTNFVLTFLHKKIRLNYTTMDDLIKLSHHLEEATIQNNKLVQEIIIGCVKIQSPKLLLDLVFSNNLMDCTCTNENHYLYALKSEVVFRSCKQDIGTNCVYCENAGDHGIVIPAGLHFRCYSDIDALDPNKVPKYLKDEIDEDHWEKFVDFIKIFSNEKREFEVSSYRELMDIEEKKRMDYDKLTIFEENVLIYNEFNILHYREKRIDDI